MANPTNVEISSSHAVAVGALAFGPLGTALPTTAIIALNAALKGLGYIGPGGVLRPRDVGTEDQRDMNGEIVYSLQTDFSRAYTSELLQNENVDIKKMIFGDANVTVTPGVGGTTTRITALDKGLVAAHGVLVGTTFDGLKSHREVAEDAQPVTVEFGPLVGTAVRSYTVTWRVFKGSVSGIYVTEYDDNGIVVP